MLLYCYINSMLTSFNGSQRFNFVTSNIPSLSYHFSKIVKSQFLVTLVITIYIKTCVSLLIFCFDDLSIGVSGVLTSPTIIVLLSISAFMSVGVCLMSTSYILGIRSLSRFHGAWNLYNLVAGERYFFKKNNTKVQIENRYKSAFLF